MGRVMYLDCFSGAAGDMMLGALVDAGLPPEELQRALGSLGVGHEIRVDRVQRAGIGATHVDVRAVPDAGHASTGPHAHGHEHHGPHHEGGHRSLSEIAHLIEHSALSAASKARAVGLFRRLAEIEAAIHGVGVEDVHLHEVGALDSIIDIAGTVVGLEWFGIDDIVASPLNLGGGTVRMAHGTFPVPAPATIRLLTGVPVYSSGVQAELVTPTGALLVTEYAREYGALPAMTVERIGYGAGSRELDPVPNVLRLLVGSRTGRPAPAGGEILQIECEIDDMSPQLFGPVSDRLFGAGALDVFLTPAQMKKGRPGTLLTVLCNPTDREVVSAILFRETTTVGVRFAPVWRETLDRRWVEVPVGGGSVRVKVASRGGAILNAAPEFDDCLRIADQTGRPVKAVQAEALAAWQKRGER